MNEWRLFTDGSVNPQTKRGFGASLLLGFDECTETLDELNRRIIIHEFTDTSSTKVELQTLLSALASIPALDSSLTVYTDSQNILSLQGRRENLETSSYHTKKERKLRNAELYQAFFKMADQHEFKLVKVKGHKPAMQRDAIDRLFNLVDRAARKACR